MAVALEEQSAVALDGGRGRVHAQISVPTPGPTSVVPVCLAVRGDGAGRFFGLRVTSWLASACSADAQRHVLVLQRHDKQWPTGRGGRHEVAWSNFVFILQPETARLLMRESPGPQGRGWQPSNVTLLAISPLKSAFL